VTGTEGAGCIMTYGKKLYIEYNCGGLIGDDDGIKWCYQYGCEMIGGVVK